LFSTAQGRFVQVPSQLQEPTKAIVRSLELHCAHDALTGARSHYARHATARAKAAGAISDDSARCARRSHTAANQAKHCVSQWQAEVADGDERFERADSSRVDAVVAKRLEQADSARVDAVVARPFLQFEDLASERSEARVLPDIASGEMRAGAAEFVPLPAIYERYVETSAGGYLAGWSELVAAQNASLALLAGRLDSVCSAKADSGVPLALSGRMQVLEEQCSAFRQQLASVRRLIEEQSVDLRRSLEATANEFKSNVIQSMDAVADMLLGKVYDLRGELRCARASSPSPAESSSSVHSTCSRATSWRSCTTATPPPMLARRREMPCHMFYAVAQECKLRLPHRPEASRPTLSLCDMPAVEWDSVATVQHLEDLIFGPDTASIRDLVLGGGGAPLVDMDDRLLVSPRVSHATAPAAGARCGAR